MILIESIAGNARDEVWQARLKRASVDSLSLDQWEAQKNRFRKRTLGGVELAVSLDRSTHLRDGDVLTWDEARRAAIIAQVHLNEVMVIRLGELLTRLPEEMLRTSIELGHALGNQHWPAVFKEMSVFVPLTVDKNVMGSVMRTHAFERISYEFIPGEEIIPHLAPHEARRLFGGAEGQVHTHVQDIP